MINAYASLLLSPLFLIWGVGVFSQAIAPDGFWIESAKQVPSLLVLALLVMKFLAHLKERDAGYVAALDRMAKSMDESTRIQGRMLEAIDNLSEKKT